jgi:hypothetical protein
MSTEVKLLRPQQGAISEPLVNNPTNKVFTIGFTGNTAGLVCAVAAVILLIAGGPYTVAMGLAIAAVSLILVGTVCMLAAASNSKDNSKDNLRSVTNETPIKIEQPPEKKAEAPPVSLPSSPASIATTEPLDEEADELTYDSSFEVTSDEEMSTPPHTPNNGTGQARERNAKDPARPVTTPPSFATHAPLATAARPFARMLIRPSQFDFVSEVAVAPTKSMEEANGVDHFVAVGMGFSPDARAPSASAIPSPFVSSLVDFGSLPTTPVAVEPEEEQTPIDVCRGFDFAALRLSLDELSDEVEPDRAGLLTSPSTSPLTSLLTSPLTSPLPVSVSVTSADWMLDMIEDEDFLANAIPPPNLATMSQDQHRTAQSIVEEGLRREISLQSPLVSEEMDDSDASDAESEFEMEALDQVVAIPQPHQVIVNAKSTFQVQKERVMNAMGRSSFGQVLKSVVTTGALGAFAAFWTNPSLQTALMNYIDPCSDITKTPCPGQCCPLT